jgi:hypothetical protein
MKNNSALPFSFSKVWFYVVGCIAWLCCFICFIQYCPAYLPDNAPVLLSDFESIPQTGSISYKAPLNAWGQSKQGVALDPDGGISGSACMKLTAHDDNEAYIKWTFSTPRDHQFLMLRVTMRTNGVVKGANNWNAARALVYFTDIKGKSHWEYPHVAGALTGTSSWKEFEKVFPVPAFAATATVLVQNGSSSGILWCDDISLWPANKNTSYFLLRNILLLAVIALAISAIRAFDLLKKRGWIPLSILVIILVGALCNQYVLEMIAGAFGLKVFLLKKVGHLFLFFILGLVSTSWAGAIKKTAGRITLSLKQLACIFIVLVSFAALTELVQFATMDRGPGKVDFFIDMTGVLAGIASAHFFSCFRKEGLTGKPV